MPGGSVTKIGRTYKKWTYIARKQNIQLTKKQHVQLKKKLEIERFSVRIPAETQMTLTEDFRNFPYSHHTNTESAHRLGHKHSLQNPFQLISHQSP
jgi:hypothetical protein